MKTLNQMIKELESIIQGEIINIETIIDAVEIIEEYKKDIADTVGDENVELYRMKLKELNNGN